MGKESSDKGKIEDGNGLKDNTLKDSKTLKGKLKMIKGKRRNRGDGKAGVLDKPFWGDLKFLKEATEVPNYF